MERNLAIPLAAAVLWTLASGCGSGTAAGLPGDPPEPEFDPGLFDAQSAQIRHRFFPLVPGTTLHYAGETSEGMETVDVEVTDMTVVILGVECVVVADRAFVDDELVEETFDWYAQDVAGNIWYLGEDSTEFEDGEPINHDGSWEAGVDGAVAGILIKGALRVGDSYQQEFYAGVAEDMARVVSVSASVQLSDGTSYPQCVQTHEWNPLEANSDEYKYFASGVGLVLESRIDGSEPIELVGVTAN